MTQSQAVDAQTLHEKQLLEKSNVVGVGVGYKESNGVNTGDLAVVVLVEEKKPSVALRDEDKIPREIDGMRTDVMEVGYLRAQQSARERYRPVIPSGVSIGHYMVTAGTLGTMVKDKVTGELLILSNNHVLANCNDALLDDAILQPSAMDSGQNPADLVARLERYMTLVYVDDKVDLQQVLVAKPSAPPPVTPSPTAEPTPIPFPNLPNNGGSVSPSNPSSPSTPAPTQQQPNVPATGNSGCNLLSTVIRLINGIASATGSQQRVITTQAAQFVPAGAGGSPMVVAQAVAQSTTAENRVDAALGRPLDQAMFSDSVKNIGVINQTKAPMLGMRVRKYGRTTEYTEGAIKLLNATVNVTYSTQRGQRIARFTGQVIADGMSQGGDSGSLIVDAQENKAVGLLFAGSNLATIFTPIDLVLDIMGVTI